MSLLCIYLLFLKLIFVVISNPLFGIFLPVFISKHFVCCFLAFLFISNPLIFLTFIIISNPLLDLSTFTCYNFQIYICYICCICNIFKPLFAIVLGPYLQPFPILYLPFFKLIVIILTGPSFATPSLPSRQTAARQEA